MSTSVEQSSSAGLRRALFIVHSYPPSLRVGVQRTLRFIRYLPAFGWSADVVAPAVPSGEAVQDVAGVGDVIRPPEWLPLQAAVRARNSLRSAFTRAQTGRSAERAAPRESDEDAEPGTPGRSLAARIVDPWFSTPDEHIGWYPRAVSAARSLAIQRQSEVLYTSGPPHSAHLIALRLQGKLGIPWVADFRDPWARNPWLPDVDRRGWRHAAQVRMEAAVIDRAHRVVLNTAAMADEFRAHYPRHASKFVTITNGYDPAAQTPLAAHLTAPVGVLTMVHAGSLYKRRDPGPLLDALARVLRDEAVPPGRLQMRFLGHIDSAFRVPAQVQALGLGEAVELAGRVSHAESLASMARAQVLILLQPGTQLQVPAKFFEYMQTERTILALTPDGATADIVRAYRLGTVVPAEDVSAIAAAIADLWRRFAGGESLRVDPRSALHAFDGRDLTGRLAGVFAEVASQ